LAASGFPTQAFLFLGFPPIRSKDRNEWFARLAVANTTVVFFEAPHRIRQTLEEMQARVGDLPIVLARELTKLHEQLVRGPISTVLEDTGIAVGEITVVVDGGHMTNRVVSTQTSDADIAQELGLLTDSGQITRRQAIQTVARKHGWRPNDVYAAVERARRLGK
ncbi:MAG TPA: SAM-dependent methyltransferase, partial [Vicinamibacterales bacterium]|nr:SAM-dependent methyltransferase [Vicinamibacterales bacterium]